MSPSLTWDVRVCVRSVRRCLAFREESPAAESAHGRALALLSHHVAAVALVEAGRPEEGEEGRQRRASLKGNALLVLCAQRWVRVRIPSHAPSPLLTPTQSSALPPELIAALSQLDADHSQFPPLLSLLTTFPGPAPPTVLNRLLRAPLRQLSIVRLRMAALSSSQSGLRHRLQQEERRRSHEQDTRREGAESRDGTRDAVVQAESALRQRTMELEEERTVRLALEGRVVQLQHQLSKRAYDALRADAQLDALVVS